MILQSMLPRWGAVIAASTAHINVDEGGAPERVAGIKILNVPTDDGKLTPELIRAYPARVGDEHFAQVGVVSITNSTEVGTVYTPTEIRAIADVVHDMGWVLHLDGSRLSNAAAALGVELRELTTDAGVDILSLGGTKIGAMLAEAVVVLSPDRVTGATFLRKQSMQLASKMRFVSAQLLAIFEGDLWRRNAEHANAMARRLADGVADIEGITLPTEVEANAVFPILARESSERLMESFRFYFWDETTGQVRWMCAWDTTESDVDTFVEAVRAELS